MHSIIYFTGEHFTAHVIMCTGMGWFYDGIFTGSSLVYETADVTSVPTENAITAIYIQTQDRTQTCHMQ